VRKIKFKGGRLVNKREFWETTDFHTSSTKQHENVVSPQMVLTMALPHKDFTYKTCNLKDMAGFGQI